MARYKDTVTVYKDPAGKIMMGPTALHFVGDLFSGLGLMGVLGVILSLMEGWGVPGVAASVAAAVVGFVLGPVLCRKAKQNAQAACQNALAEKE